MENINHKPELIVIAGPNGSGKTSVTQKFLHHEWGEGVLYINPDEVAKDIFGDWNSNDAILKSLPILIKSKNSLVKENNEITLWNELEEWIDDHSGIYVQKIWNNSFEKARNKFLKKLNHNTHWPKVLYDVAKEDDLDPADELNELIVQNIRTRMTPLEFEEDQINKARQPSREELIEILQNQRFCPNDVLNRQFLTGDVYKVSNEKVYYLNITPACDCISRNKKTVKYLLLKCELTSKPSFNSKYGLLEEMDTEALVGPLFGGKTLKVNFKTLEIKKNEELEDKYIRLGRIQHPFITRIIQSMVFLSNVKDFLEFRRKFSLFKKNEKKIMSKKL